jgi:hypothetical protein
MTSLARIRDSSSQLPVLGGLHLFLPFLSHRHLLTDSSLTFNFEHCCRLESVRSQAHYSFDYCSCAFIEFAIHFLLSRSLFFSHLHGLYSLQDLVISKFSTSGFSRFSDASIGGTLGRS